MTQFHDLEKFFEKKIFEKSFFSNHPKTLFRGLGGTGVTSFHQKKFEKKFFSSKCIKIIFTYISDNFSPGNNLVALNFDQKYFFSVFT